MAQAALGAAVSTDALTLVGVFPSACSPIAFVATGASVLLWRRLKRSAPVVMSAECQPGTLAPRGLTLFVRRSPLVDRYGGRRL
jgi:hypothetical protein